MNSTSNAQLTWEAYCENELSLLRPLLYAHGFTLNDIQPHIIGERFLMHAITTTSGKKMILLGSKTDGTKVVIKVTNDAQGIKELEHERICRKVLTQLDFAAKIFHTPEEIAYIHERGYTITIQKFIDQEQSFLERPLASQFGFALQGFKEQESAHAATFKHRKVIEGTFGIRNAETYLATFASFRKNITAALSQENDINRLLQTAEQELVKNKIYIEQYSSFLTHTDFVPHNIRISGNIIYLLDYSSLTFGNKYEGWARFINFMTLYNPPLQKALEKYVQDNRTQEETISLRMMRIYRLGEIIWYYTQTLQKSSDDLLKLNTERVHFWAKVLSYVLTDQEVPDHVIAAYTTIRDALRSNDEKKRQQGLH